MYDTGRGLPAAPDEAAFWYGRAAARGLAVAQNNLGALYATGEGVPADISRAYLWFSLAAAGNHQGAHTNRNTIAEAMTAGEIAQARLLLRAWRLYQRGRFIVA